MLGRLVDIPTEDDYVVGYDPYPKSIGDGQYCPLCDRKAVITALSSPPSSSLNVLRVDLEPCWEDNPENYSFILRAGGLPRSRISINKLCDADKRCVRGAHSAENNPLGSINCVGRPGPSCPGPETILRYILYLHDQWFELPLLRLVETAKLGEIPSPPASPQGKPSNR